MGKGNFFKLVIIISITFITKASFGQNTFLLQYKSTTPQQQTALTNLKLQTNFLTAAAGNSYLTALPNLLQSKGYLFANIDSVFIGNKQAEVTVYLGQQYQWVQLNLNDVPNDALYALNLQKQKFTAQPVNLNTVNALQQNILNYYLNSGYPFATVGLTNFKLLGNTVSGSVQVTPGVLYKIDSIRLFGTASISSSFLQRYLGITNGSAYNKLKLTQVDAKLLQLPYLQSTKPADLTMLARGSVLNIYAVPKKISTVSAIIGFLPNPTNTGKLQLTGDINLNLKNNFGNGETIVAFWQQIQLKSPRLQLGYQQPYLLGSKFGIDVNVEIFKKDSSFLQTQLQGGVVADLATNQQIKLYFQQQGRRLLTDGVDTNFVKQQKQLPINADVSLSNIGLDYLFNNTDYRLNPLKGYDIAVAAQVGLKSIKTNDVIVALKEPGFNYASLYDSIEKNAYQIRVNLTANKYTFLGGQSTLKTGVTIGSLTSPTLFRNELFQIGGFKLLRGFNEESIYATNFVVANAEYRYRLGLNSYFFGFINQGLVQTKFKKVNSQNSYTGTGIGMVLENKFGIINFSYALGFQKNTLFKFGDASKIHFGYINYF
jgi:hypothetical protein